MENEKERGITLIALVVTIVVLLILAGVSISLVLNNNGVISKAKDAKNQYAEAQANEEKHFNEVTDWIDIKISDYDPTSEEVPIPAGFVYVGGTKDSGLVISDNENDKEKYKGKTTVGTDLVGNQFVWIPVDKIDDYKRTAYSYNVASGIIDTDTNSEQIEGSDSSGNFYFTETLPEDEKLSVEKNKGFYLGRYEAGDEESTDKKAFRTDSSNKNNTVTVKSGQVPYNYVTREEAQALSEGFYIKQGYISVKSKLVSSYAWDTAIAFIQKINSDYGRKSEEGNYYDTTFSYTDITGIVKTKSSSSEILVPTGQTTAVNNIFDMGGNVYEWTTENCSSESYPYTVRGGFYRNYSFSLAAGYRIEYTSFTYPRPRFQDYLVLVEKNKQPRKWLTN